MQIVLEQGSIDKPLTFNIGLLKHIFGTIVFTCMHAKGVFNLNFSIFSPSSAEGLHFSGFHLFMKAKVTAWSRVILYAFCAHVQFVYVSYMLL